MTNAFEPGARPVIDELSSQMGVSPIPIREALQQLRAEGFVTIEPYIGATVAGIDAASIDEIFALLESLQVISACKASTCISDEQLDRSEQLLQRMDALTADSSHFSQANMQLCEYICDCAQLPLVRYLSEQVLYHWDRLRGYCLEEVFAQRIHVAQREHWHLLEALCMRDPVRVEHLIREHNRAECRTYAGYWDDLCQENARVLGRVCPVFMRPQIDKFFSFVYTFFPTGLLTLSSHALWSGRTLQMCLKSAADRKEVLPRKLGLFLIPV